MDLQRADFYRTPSHHLFCSTFLLFWVFFKLRLFCWNNIEPNIKDNNGRVRSELENKRGPLFAGFFFLFRDIVMLIKWFRSSILRVLWCKWELWPILFKEESPIGLYSERGFQWSHSNKWWNWHKIYAGMDCSFYLFQGFQH